MLITMDTTPWIEKYRPKSFKSLILPEYIKKDLLKRVKNGEPPNIVLTGSPGIGKTTTLLTIARCLFGKTIMQNMIELNASDDRGIKTVKTEINEFCRGILVKGEGCVSKKKMIILDEADNMTSKAQLLVSNLMDRYADKVMFGITCNSSSGIVEPIQSRCKKIRFKPLLKNEVIKRLQLICKIENVVYYDKGLDRIYYYGGGDLRKSINILQTVWEAYPKVNSKNVDMVSDIPSPMKYRRLLKTAENETLINLIKILDKELFSGNTPLDIVAGLINYLRYDGGDFNIATRCDLYELAATTIKNIYSGIDSRIQLHNLFLNIQKNLKN